MQVGKTLFTFEEQIYIFFALQKFLQNFLVFLKLGFGTF